MPSEKNPKTSQRFAVFVIVGAEPEGHLTLVNEVVVKFPEPVFAINVNDLPAAAVGIVKVQFAVNVIV